MWCLCSSWSWSCSQFCGQQGIFEIFSSLFFMTQFCFFVGYQSYWSSRCCSKSRYESLHVFSKQYTGKCRGIKLGTIVYYAIDVNSVCFYLVVYQLVWWNCFEWSNWSSLWLCLFLAFKYFANLEKTETSNKETDCSWLDYQNSWWGNLFCGNNLLNFLL